MTTISSSPATSCAPQLFHSAAAGKGGSAGALHGEHHASNPRSASSVHSPVLPKSSPTTPRGLRQVGELLANGDRGRVLQGPRAAQMKIGGKKSKGPLAANREHARPPSAAIWSACISRRDSIDTMTEKVVEAAAAAATEEHLARGTVISARLQNWLAEGSRLGPPLRARRGLNEPVFQHPLSDTLHASGDGMEADCDEAWDLPPFSHQRAFPTFT